MEEVAGESSGLMDTRQLQALLEVTRVLAAEVSLDALLKLILDTSREIVDAARSTIYLLEPGASTLRAHLALGVERTLISLPIGRGLANHVASTGEIVNLRHAHDDPRFDRSVDESLGSETTTLLTVPMRSRRAEIVGVLQALNKRQGVFTAEDEGLLLSLASSASLAIENAYLYEQVRVRERMKRDLEIAQVIQTGLLPLKPPALGGVQFAVSYAPALQIGGDFYDFPTGANNDALVVVGDVSGKGVPAGLMVGLVRMALRSEARRTASLAQVLSSCNRLLYEDFSHTNMFATAFMAAVDHDARSLRFSNAGHCQAVLYRASNGQAELLDADGLPLGILSDGFFEDKSVPLRPGDALVLYTDGFTEAIGDERRGQAVPIPVERRATSNSVRRYGVVRFVEDVRRHAHLPAEQMRMALVHEIDQFSHGAQQSDDRTLVAIKIGPSG